jgi:hypothetical protein
MNIIIPIFPASKFESQLATEAGADLQGLCESINRFRLRRDFPAFVLTDNAQLVGKIKTYGLDCILLANSAKTESRPAFPPGAEHALHWLREKCRSTENTHLLMIDYRCDWLSDEILEAAYCKFLDSNSDLGIALKSVTDHPIQMDVHYNIIDIDILVTMEDRSNRNYQEVADALKPLDTLMTFGTPVSEVAASSPFYFNWPSTIVSGNPPDGQIFIRVPDSSHSVFKEWESLDKDEAATFLNAGCCYIYVGSTSARRLLNENFLNPPSGIHISALSITRDIHDMPVLITRSERDSENSVYLRGSSRHGHTRLKIFPFQSHPVKIGRPASINGCRFFQDGDGDLFFQTGTYKGQALSFDTVDAATGYIVVFLKHAIDEKVDIVEPVHVNPRLWDIDPSTHLRTNALSGKVVFGRQDFPPVYERDGAFIFSRLMDLEGIAESLKKRKSGVVVVDRFPMESGKPAVDAAAIRV